MICCSKQVCKEISSGAVPYNRAQEIVIDFHFVLRSYKKPVGHGTSSEYLDSIVALGLGAKIPENSWKPGVIAVTDVSMSGGLVGAYAFALREEVFRFFRRNLVLNAVRNGGRCVIRRYIELIGMQGFRSQIACVALSYIGIRYCLKRGKKCGWPTLLIYDVGEEVPLIKEESAGAPPEYCVQKPIPSQYLKLVLVPVAHIEDTARILGNNANDYSIMPLEILELEEEVVAYQKNH